VRSAAPIYGDHARCGKERLLAGKHLLLSVLQKKNDGALTLVARGLLGWESAIDRSACGGDISKEHDHRARTGPLKFAPPSTTVAPKGKLRPILVSEFISLSRPAAARVFDRLREKQPPYVPVPECSRARSVTAPFAEASVQRELARPASQWCWRQA
jgi:hypothetical protein